MSRFELLNVRHDDITVHVPTTLPPQGVPFEQEAPPIPAAPVVPDAPLPELPPTPDGELLNELHPAAIVASASADARAADRTFENSFIGHSCLG
jgi:hypothetical protein